MDKLIFESAARLAEAIRHKEISSQELVQSCLNRIAKVNPQLNAVVQLTADTALARAREAQSSLTGTARSYNESRSQLPESSAAIKLNARSLRFRTSGR